MKNYHHVILSAVILVQGCSQDQQSLGTVDRAPPPEQVEMPAVMPSAVAPDSNEVLTTQIDPSPGNYSEEEMARWAALKAEAEAMRPHFENSSMIFSNGKISSLNGGNITDNEQRNLVIAQKAYELANINSGAPIVIVENARVLVEENEGSIEVIFDRDPKAKIPFSYKIILDSEGEALQKIVLGG